MAKKDLTTLKVKLEFDDKGALKKINGMKTNLKGMGDQGGKSLGGLSGGFAKMAVGIGSAVVALGTLKKAFDFALQVGGDFEQAMANVKAISGATGVSFKALEDDAKRLGASTKFTASQVAGLQLEFSKLGFTAEEIVKVTEATLNLASATGEQLAPTAMVAGSTLRGFGLDAEETSRVTDVMAMSFSSSALDLEKFRESMKMVAPIAKGVGFNVEETTAILAELSNVGLHGSLAGTALKNIFIKMGDENGKMAKKFGKSIKTFDDLKMALKVLKDENMDFNDALGLTDKRSAAAFLALASGVDNVENLKNALDEAGGSAERMALIQMDTVQGSLLELTSATEGFGIALFEHFSEPLQNAVDSLTGFMQGMTDAIDETETMTMAVEESRMEFNSIMHSLRDANTPLEVRKELISEVNLKYGDYIKNLLTEKTTIDDIKTLQEDANKAFDIKIEHMVLEQSLVSLAKENKQAIKERVVQSKLANQELDKYLKLYGARHSLWDQEAIDAMTMADRQEVLNEIMKEREEWNKKVFDGNVRMYDIEFQNSMLRTDAIGKHTDKIAQLDEQMDRTKEGIIEENALMQHFLESLPEEIKMRLKIIKTTQTLSGGEEDVEDPVEAVALTEEEIFKLKQKFMSKSSDLFKFNLDHRLDLLRMELDEYAQLKDEELNIDAYASARKREIYLMTAQYFAQTLASSTKAMAQAGMIGGATAKRMAQLEATVTAFVMANKAYSAGLSLPPPANLVVAPIMAGLALASGLANVRMIEKQKFALGGAVSQPTLALLGEGGQEEFVAPKQQFKEWASEQIGDMNFSLEQDKVVDKLDNIQSVLMGQKFPSASNIANAVSRISRGKL